MNYSINEIFYSIQGEGIRAGTANVFVRFAGCNQTCKVESHGFDCDTEFVSHVKMSAKDILDEAKRIAPDCRAIILTGGEPGLQLDTNLVHGLRDAGYFLAIETNGSIELPFPLDWITVSPKVAEHCIRQLIANECKYVRHAGQGIPQPRCKADHYLLSPAANGERVDREALQWCINLVKAYPQWRLSVQQHKNWGAR